MSSASATPARLSTQAFWLLVAKTVSFGLTLILPLLLVRVLSVFTYGLFKQVFLVVTTAQAILPLNIGMSAFYFLSRDRDRRASTVLHILLFDLVVGGGALAVLWAFPQMLTIIFGSPELVPYRRWVGVLIVLWLVSSMLEYIATAEREVLASTVFIVTSQLSKVVLLSVAVLWSPTIEAILWASALQGAGQTAMLLYYLHKRFPGFWRALDWRHFRDQLGYSAPLGASGLLYRSQMDLHHYFISHQFGPAGYAIYAVGCSQVPLIGLIYESLASVLLPRFSALQQQGEHRQILKLAAAAVRKQALAYWGMYAYLLVVSREYILALFTAQYQASAAIFSINLAMIPLMMLGVTDPILRAYAHYRYVPMLVRAPVTAVLVFTLVVGTKTMGMVGVIAAVVVLTAIDRVLICWKAAQVLGFRRSDLRLFSGVLFSGLAAGAAAAVTAGVRYALAGHSALVVLLVTGPVFAIAYGAILWGCGLLDAEERELVFRYARRFLRPAAATRQA